MTRAGEDAVAGRRCDSASACRRRPGSSRFRRSTTTPGAAGRCGRCTRQHPIRGSFLDPAARSRARRDLPRRASTSPCATTGPSAARRRDARTASSRSRAGRCRRATPRGARGLVRVGHFGYGHIDPLVRTGRDRRARRSTIGWTCDGDWHVHLSEFVFTDRRRRSSSTRSGRAGSCTRTSTARAPDDPGDPLLHARDARAGRGGRTTSVARLPQAGRRLDEDRARRPGRRPRPRERPADLHRLVRGAAVARRAAPSVPARGHGPSDLATGRVVRRREVFRAEQLLGLAAGQSLRARAPSRTCPRTAACGCHALGAAATASTGSGSSRVRYWDTTQLADGRYRRARCAPGTSAGNLRSADAYVTDRQRRLDSERCQRSSGIEPEPGDRARELQPGVALRGVAP